MRKWAKYLIVIVIFLAALAVINIARPPSLLTFFAMQAESIQHAGTWEDDPENWHRAFGEQLPAQVKVIHSKYWRSDHFTVEFVYFFEVEGKPEWRDEFLKTRHLVQIPPAVARTFRTNTHTDLTPNWFAPDPIELYDVWDKTGGFGSVWINKTNGHIFFYDAQL